MTIENVFPELDCGRFPVKRSVGDTFEVWADIFRYGKDEIRASLKHRKAGSDAWKEVPMSYYDNDRWVGRFVLEEVGIHEYTIQAWTDAFATALHALEKWAEAGEDVSVDIRGLHRLVEESMQKAVGPERLELSQLLEAMRGANEERALGLAKAPRLAQLLEAYSPPREQTSHRTLRVVVGRGEARFAAWYEMFHRSQGTVPERGATFKDCERRLPEIRSMGFDVVYLPPIHPIGRTNRRGKNNSANAREGDPGSPWAIGSEEGGHTTLNPELGTMGDFQHFLEAAKGMGMEVAIDLALQCSPDHPYVKEHPEWFFHRSDGTIRYAENPPKKYFDIYPLRFDGENWKGLWEEALRVVLFWVEKGVKTFRVDNPHTKPPGFWEWMIGQVKERYPGVIFLAEAFTRPKLTRLLAKVGFDESYTYFTWKNTQAELRGFLDEFVTSEASEYFAGNLFTNTPDILSEYLQRGGRNAFKIRLVLAATLSSLYGIYNGFELCENRPVEEGSEEYLDSEKYQYKVWDWDRRGNIKDFITKVNEIRRNNPALHLTKNLRLLESTNENVFFYGKWTQDRSNVIFVAVNLDPVRAHEAMVSVPLTEIGLDPTRSFTVIDLVTKKEFEWKGTNYVRLDPSDEPAHILQLQGQQASGLLHP
ncbi:MAG: alpha-1,4-glucan--maltose-1-phosphate maltosyltransferase [Thaumarchaeota archaeon]|nr:alpha-1,4-glucan--maltose-1-phosphate maltosyltransferase [Nitrososphaerota archaeon]